MTLEEKYPKAYELIRNPQPGIETISVPTLDRNSGSWELSVTSRADIKRSLSYGLQKLREETLYSKRRRDCLLVFNKTVEIAVRQSQEVRDFMRAAVDAYTDDPVHCMPPYQLFGIPIYLEGCIPDRIAFLVLKNGETAIRFIDVTEKVPT